MSSKRKWDQAGDGDDVSPHKAQKSEDSKSASEAAAAAAAIAAKIAAQFSGGATGNMLGPKDPHDGAFTHDIDINDIRNRYLLTRGSTQEQVTTKEAETHSNHLIFMSQIHDETGASVTTKGVWYPDRAKATDKDPPLYLHISASSKAQMDDAIAKVNELMAMELGSLVEDKKDMRRERVRMLLFPTKYSLNYRRGNGRKKN